MNKKINLKLLLVLLLILEFKKVSFSQSFTLNELLSLSKLSEDDFDTKVNLKGYEYYTYINDDYCKSKSYSYAKSINAETASYYITYRKCVNFIYKYGVSWQTLNQKDYLNIKVVLKAHGFNYINTEENNGNIKLNYSKGNIEVSLWSSQAKATGGKIINFYEINVKVK